MGEEFYIRVFRRCYDLLASRSQTNYNSVHDSRIEELRTILALVRAWYQCNEHFGNVAQLSKTECHKKFLSHQLYWDIQLMIEGFIGLVQYREQRWGLGNADVRARNCSQDSLESLFGRLRMACGSGQAVSMSKAVQALPREDQRTQVRWSYKVRQTTNSGRSGSDAASGSDSSSNGPSGLATSEAIRPLTAAFYLELRQTLAATTVPSCRPVLWKTLRDVVEADESAFLNYYRLRRLYWINTAIHIVKSGFSRMRVGLALDVMRFDVASYFHALRYQAMRP